MTDSGADPRIASRVAELKAASETEGWEFEIVTEEPEEVVYQTRSTPKASWRTVTVSLDADGDVVVEEPAAVGRVPLRLTTDWDQVDEAWGAAAEAHGLTHSAGTKFMKFIDGTIDRFQLRVSVVPGERRNGTLVTASLPGAPSGLKIGSTSLWRSRKKWRKLTGGVPVTANDLDALDLYLTAQRDEELRSAVLEKRRLPTSNQRVWTNVVDAYLQCTIGGIPHQPEPLVELIDLTVDTAKRITA